MKRIIVPGIAALIVAASIASCWFLYRFSIRSIPLGVKAALPVVHLSDEGIALESPSGRLLGEVGVYSDELTAYLHFEYLRSLKDVSVSSVMMTSPETAGEPVYKLNIALPNDWIRGVNYLSVLEAKGFIPNFKVLQPPASSVQDWEQQTQLFLAAYDEPVRERLLELPPHYLSSAVAKFILFKVKTDRRIREQILPVTASLSPAQARQFAADMIDVARFYRIPLSMLLGIGAMENNYLDVKGDLEHATWKRRAQPGDIVLKREKRRVLVSDYSTGPWQITRETLRYAHQLYLHDKRDYSALPARLIPPKKLDLDHVDAGVLTTYAGLLLRSLLDRFNGDVQKAVGAYNGGVAKPNEQYAEGVSLVASYAHRVLSLAAGQKGIAVSESELATAPTSSTIRGRSPASVEAPQALAPRE